MENESKLKLATGEEMMQGMVMAGLWDVRRTSVFLGMSIRWVYQRAEEGTLPCVRLGRALRFDPTEVAAWVKKQGR